MTTAVLIHGFSGSPRSWRRVRARLDMPSCAPTLRGHGGVRPTAPAAGPGCSFDAEVDRLASVIGKAVPAARFLAGYSLGGRVALGLLVRHAGLFDGAALIGANPGIGGATERAARRTADEEWAQCIERQGLATFDREWSALPLFESQRHLDTDRASEQRRIRLGHDPEAMAAAMRALGLGVMPDYRPFLPSISCPVELIAGSLDSKFIGLARQMAGLLPAATVHIVDGVGHNVPLEAPARLARLLNDAARRTAAATGEPGSR